MWWFFGINSVGGDAGANGTVMPAPTASWQYLGLGLSVPVPRRKQCEPVRVIWLGSTKPPSKSEKPVFKTAKKGQAGGQLSGFRIVEVVKCATFCSCGGGATKPQKLGVIYLFHILSMLINTTNILVVVF
jgi:hypothetical protein